MLLKDSIRKSIAQCFDFSNLRCGLHEIKRENGQIERVYVHAIWVANLPYWFENGIILSAVHFKMLQGIRKPPQAAILAGRIVEPTHFVGKDPLQSFVIQTDADRVLEALQEISIMPDAQMYAGDQRLPDFSVQSYYEVGWSYFSYNGIIDNPKIEKLWNALLDMTQFLATIRNDDELWLSLKYPKSRF